MLRILLIIIVREQGKKNTPKEGTEKAMENLRQI